MSRLDASGGKGTDAFSADALNISFLCNTATIWMYGGKKGQVGDLPYPCVRSGSKLIFSRIERDRKGQLESTHSQIPPREEDKLPQSDLQTPVTDSSVPLLKIARCVTWARTKNISRRGAELAENAQTRCVRGKGDRRIFRGCAEYFFLV
jgi:hypothetical protein